MRAPQFIAIPALVSRELMRRTVRGARTGALYRWRYRGSVSPGFTQTPKSLRPADPSHALQFYSGEYDLAGVCVATGSESPFLMRGYGLDWTDELHAFRWLRHLDAAQTELSRAHARGLVADWIAIWFDDMESRAWHCDIVAERLISWLTHAPLIADDAPEPHKRALMRSIARQMRFLRTNLSIAQDGRPRLISAVALAYCSLCLSGREKSVRPTARDLDRELSRQILPDGGHVSRNPAVLLEFLADLLPLRDLYISCGVSLPLQLQPAIDRMFSALRFFSHSNGSLAQFNGTGETPIGLKRAVMDRADGAGQPPKSAPFSGYERLASKKTVVLMDTGKPESRMTARRAMAGTLSFELSSGKTRFIANCGVPEANYQRFAPYFRTTAAHSTATIGHSSSSRFAGSGRLRDMLPSPLVYAPTTVLSNRNETDGYEHVAASHDGYCPNFGLIHKRELFLSADGTELNGIDRFVQENRSSVAQDIHIRFHLPPDISSSPLSSGHSILLAGPQGDAWKLTCIDAPMQLEESLCFSGPDQPRKTRQVVISTTSMDHGEIRWTLSYRAAQKSSAAQRQRAGPEKTLDLLDSLLETQD